MALDRHDRIALLSWAWLLGIRIGLSLGTRLLPHP
jgi:hypothetical protein